MVEERYHATTQNWFYPDMSNVNKNITVKAKLISPPMYIVHNYTSSDEYLPMYNAQITFLLIQVSHLTNTQNTSHLSHCMAPAYNGMPMYRITLQKCNS